MAMDFNNRSYSSTGNSFRSSSDYPTNDSFQNDSHDLQNNNNSQDLPHYQDIQNSSLDQQNYSQDSQNNYEQELQRNYSQNIWNSQGLLMIQNPRGNGFPDYDARLQHMSLGTGHPQPSNYNQKQLMNLEYMQRAFYDYDHLRGQTQYLPPNYDFVDSLENGSFNGNHSTPINYRTQHGDSNGYSYPPCQLTNDVGLSPVVASRSLQFNSSSDTSSNSWQRQYNSYKSDDNNLQPSLQMNLEQHNTVNNIYNCHNYVVYCSHDRPEICQHPCGTGIKDEMPKPRPIGNSAHLPMTPIPAISPPHHLEISNEDIHDLQEFSRIFKQRRISLGYTQAEVGEKMGQLFGKEFSQTTICRFESLQLSVRNMNKLKPLVKKWLEGAEKNMSSSTEDTDESIIPSDTSNPNDSGNSENIEALAYAMKQRKKRTSIDIGTTQTLEEEYKRNDKPSREELTRIAEIYKIDYGTVRVWFCNRRQREKKLRNGVIDNTASNTVANALQRADRKYK